MVALLCALLARAVRDVAGIPALSPCRRHAWLHDYRRTGSTTRERTKRLLPSSDRAVFRLACFPVRVYTGRWPSGSPVVHHLARYDQKSATLRGVALAWEPLFSF